MRSNLAFILARQPVNAAESGTDVTLSWMATTGGTFDPVSRSTIGGTRTPQTLSVRALGVHTVKPGENTVRQFNEIEVGDLIVDFLSTANLESKPELTFTVDGQVYVQRAISGAAAQSFDAIVNNQRITRTVVLRKAT